MTMKQKHHLQEDDADGDCSLDETTPLKTKRWIRKSTPKRNNKHQSFNATQWLLLTLCCIIMACMYYILAMPAALHQQLMALMTATSSSSDDNFEMKFNLLFTVSYFPNMIIPMLGGAIVDRYGPAPCLVTFCVVVCMGQIVTTWGAAVTVDWHWLWMGRFIFGLGAQNLIVANASLLSQWFAGGKEGTALGLCNVFSYAGVIATNLASPRWANLVTPVAPFWVGVGAGCVAVILSIAVAWIDHSQQDMASTAPRKESRPSAQSTPLVCSPMFSPVAFSHSPAAATHTTVLSSPGAVVFAAPLMDNEAEEANGLLESSPSVDNNNMLLAPSSSSSSSSSWQNKLRHFKPTFWLLCTSFLLIYGVVWSFTNVSSGLLLERDLFVIRSPQQNTCVLAFPNQCTAGSLAPRGGNAVVMKDAPEQSMECLTVKDNMAPILPTSLNITIISEEGDKIRETLFQMLHLSSADVQCNEVFWAEECTKDYCDALKVATEKAGFFMSIPYFFTVALTSLLGVFVDKTGWRTEMITLGSMLLVLAHALLAFPSSSPPVIPLVGQGLGYTICVAALWPSVPFTVRADSVGLAFGIMMAVQNIGLAVMPLIVAWLYGRHQNQYLPSVEIFFAACSVVAVGVGVALKIADKATDRVLGTPKPDIRVRQDRNGMVVLVVPSANSKPRHVRSNSDAGYFGSKSEGRMNA